MLLSAAPQPDESPALWMSRHRAHDVTWLLEAWDALAARIPGLCRETLCDGGGLPVIGLRRDLGEGVPTLYISAGIHGDEAAAPLGLLWWAEEALADCPCSVALLPCLNPWGLANNTRLDSAGADLNRLFDDHAHPLVAAWERFTSGDSYAAALCLHEDYDAVGAYCYELAETPGVAAALFSAQAGRALLSPDLRPEIDGMLAEGGVITPHKNREMPTEDLPEAVRLYGPLTGLSLTFETPSEFSLYDRVTAHRLFIEGLVEHLAAAR